MNTLWSFYIKHLVIFDKVLVKMLSYLTEVAQETLVQAAFVNRQSLISRFDTLDQTIDQQLLKCFGSLSFKRKLVKSKHGTPENCKFEIYHKGDPRPIGQSATIFLLIGQHLASHLRRVVTRAEP